MQPLDRRSPARNGIGMVLGEVAQRDFMTPYYNPVVHIEVPVGVFDEAGGAAYQRFQQRGFSRPVAAHQRNLLAARDAGSEAADYLQLAVAFRQPLYFQRMAARRTLHVKTDVRPLDIRPRQVRSLQSLYFLLARHHLARPRAR